MSIIVQKAKRILEGLEYGAFITSKEWEEKNFDYYYNYFSDPDSEIRKYSLLVFAAGLGNWNAKSAFVFSPLEELKKDPLYNPDTVYYFPDYIEAFIENNERVKQDYPKLYRMIILFLRELDNQESFSEILPEQELFKELQKLLNDPGVEDGLIYDGFQEFLYEIGLPNFYAGEF